jgi:thiol-disulfide isomerase/thioredoxin
MSVIGEYMKTLEVIEKDLRETREALANTEGRDAEVYSRIVGYYRSVRNWNKGKREEFGDRKMFVPPVSTDNGTVEDPAVSENGFCESCRLPTDLSVDDDAVSRLVRIPAVQAGNRATSTETTGHSTSTDGIAMSPGLFQDADLSVSADPREAGSNPRIVLFVRRGCPSCPAAKTEAGKLAENFGVCVETVNADTEAGLAEARRLGVTATPTAILLRDNAELSRAKDRDGIADMSRFFEPLRRSA